MNGTSKQGEFKELLKKLMSVSDLTPAEMSKRSGVSQPTVSRYLNGTRLPERDGEILAALVSVIYESGEEYFRSKNIHEEDIRAAMMSSVMEKEHFDHARFRTNLKTLMGELGVSANSLSKELFLSSSSLSRILSGKSNSSDPQGIIDKMGEFLERNYSEDEEVEIVRGLLERETGFSWSDDREVIFEGVKQWLAGDFLMKKRIEAESFLARLDEFDIAEYLKAVDVSKLRIPTTKYKIPSTKNFIGIKGMEEGILEFLKATATSSVAKEIFLYNDHPIEHLLEEQDFAKKWQKGIGANVLQGKNVSVLHDTERPAHEMMLGLQSWIPLHMTGQVKSFYSEGTPGDMFHHILLVSDSAVLMGYCLKGDYQDGRYIFSKANPKIAEGRRMADQMLSTAKRLVYVYGEDESSVFYNTLWEDAVIVGERHQYSGNSLPVATIGEETLEQIISINNVDEKIAAEIRSYVSAERQRLGSILEHSIVRETIREWMIGENDEEPPKFMIEGRFCDEQLSYDANTYTAHLRETESFAAGNEKYVLEKVEKIAYDNIRIMVRENGTSIISRNKSPERHFVIYHPAVVDCVYNLSVPIWEE